MATMELNSFLHKFSQLWKSGQDAHLEFHTHAGNAWISLNLNLGKRRFSFPSNHRKPPSPSRLRRRERRAAARQDITENETQTANSDICNNSRKNYLKMGFDTTKLICMCVEVT